MRYNKPVLIGRPKVCSRTPIHFSGLMRYIQVEDVSSVRLAVESTGALVISDGRSDSTFTVFALDPRYEAIMKVLKNAG